jgi:hypothetical protein
MSGRKREREAPEVGAMAARVLRALVRRAGTGDTEALEQLLGLELELAEAIRDAGRELHAFGYSFTELGRVAGVSRQAARERFSAPIDVDELPAADEPVRYPWDDTPSAPAIPATTDTTRHDAQMGLAR